MTAEKRRLQAANTGKTPWKKWGPYLTERQWGTVREDYSENGNAWGFISHDMARSKAYRWGEEGIAGISDDTQSLCFSLACWNGADPFLKERLFGVAGNEGNHGEDVKEYYYYLDSTPTHSYMKMLYKYPQQEFPYELLLAENRRRGKRDREFELVDTGIFSEDRYFDVFIEYAKATAEDVCIRITAINRGPGKASLDLLPHLWFRNTWSWHNDAPRPKLSTKGNGILATIPDQEASYFLYADGNPELLFCENESNPTRLYNLPADEGFFKDGINDYVVNGQQNAVNPEKEGTRMACRFQLEIAPGESQSIRLRFSNKSLRDPFQTFDKVYQQRQAEADDFYADLQEGIGSEDARNVQRQALAGMLWSKQFYYFNVAEWLSGDANQPPPPEARKAGRNREWLHLHNADIISMPDKWEYPWYAAWDLAFHCIPLAMVDAAFAKEQLLLLTREWYMHPNGQLPAYEWAFSDVNPPVHAWAAWRVYKIEKKQRGGKGDIRFLEAVFHKMLLNFTWWVNRKDEHGDNLFQGGFLGLDNIGVFDRSAPLPTGGHLEQADGTSWMAMYSLNLMRMSIELALHNPVYQSTATKFFEHFLYIAGAMANIGQDDIDLWDDEDKFFYDAIHFPNGAAKRLKVRSMVGLIPLFAVETLEPGTLEKLPEFKARLEWFLENRPDLASLVSRWFEPGLGERRLLSLLRGHRMKRLLKRMLDENEFLSEYGVRALSKYHQANPYTFHLNNHAHQVSYVPGESDSYMFGGNSNWRGPVWFPVNFLIIESLQKFHHYYSDDFTIEYPTGSGKYVTIADVAESLSERLCRLFLRDENGRRAVFGDADKFQNDPHFRDHLLFYEYFHGDNGRGVGASHQTGWTGLVAKLLQPRGKKTK